MKQRGPNLLEREGTRSVLASVISIIIGMLVGSILILIMGLSNSSLGPVSYTHLDVYKRQLLYRIGLKSQEKL